MAKILTNSDPLGLPGMDKIIELAKLLRDSGDKVLSASSKLSLSTMLLMNLNDAFSLIINETDDLECSFQVCNSSRNEIFRDIKFLHDIVQKTMGLKIQYNPNDMKVNVDITKFRHLKYLELQKIPIEMVRGIQGIRGQIECIVCVGGRVNTVNELLAACGGDGGAGFVWGSLRRLALPYNALTHLDKSLEFAPWLETIDFSHNRITKATELEYLPNLRNINLSFNNLGSIPHFNKATYHTLQRLILKNNYFDNIDGLEGLETLVELDLSYNCLAHHSMLWPLETMSMLMWLSLEGNPIFYHPRHRLNTMKYLHPSLSKSKFILDVEPLNKSEKLFVSENRLYVLRPSMHRSRTSHDGECSSLTNSVTSNYPQTSWQSDSFIAKNQATDALEHSVDLVFSGSKTTDKRKKRAKEAFIAEDNFEREQPGPKNSSLCKSYRESSMDHLETKQRILALRDKYGQNNWLSCNSEAYIQSIMGLEPTTALSDAVLSSTFTDTQQSFMASSDAVNIAALISPISQSNLARYVEETVEAKTTKIPEQNKMEVKKDGMVEPQMMDREPESMDEGIVVETETENEGDENAFSNTAEVKETLEDSYDPDEEKGDLYLVQKKTGQEELQEIFLLITPEDIKERDSITGKIKYRWAMNTVLSCILGRGKLTTVNITFDTTRKDREARTYITETEDAKKIVHTLNKLINIQPMVLTIYKCMKCSTHFSQDDKNFVTSSFTGTQSKCPTCKSTLVIQTDELPSPTLEHFEKNPEKVKLESQKEYETQLPHSSSQSSIGSATSLGESRESTPSAGTLTRKYESDIEILSNPSQSSIEVLDDGSKIKTPHRKKSSEERRVAVAPSLLTISDSTLVMAGLTESSSSGSLTDSVCTAYENKSLKLLDKNEMSSNRSPSKADTIKDDSSNSESTFAPVTNLTSALGELLQSMKIGPSKATASKPEDSSEFVGSNIEYSYIDFNNIDHRIKLHIILNIFEHENEDLALLLRAEISTQSSMDTFPGCLILSTAKVYILKIIGPEGEDPQRWLHKEASWTIDRLRSFAPLPFKQGVLVELQQPNKPGDNNVLCILQDFQRTSNFLFYLTNSPLPPGCEVEFTVPQHCNTSMTNIMKSSKNYKEDSIRLLAIFSSAVLKSPDVNLNLKVSSLIVTSSTLIAVQDKVQWLLSASNELPPIASEQGISNLIEVDFNGNSLTLNFLDEVAEREATWIFEFVSSTAAETVINSIRPQWEDLFLVPLQVNVPRKDRTINPERT